MNKLIQDAIHNVLKEHGFRRKSSTWSREEEESILVVNLQRSLWGEVYYVNLAVWLKALGKLRQPKEYLCHIRKRLEGAKFEQALNCDDLSISQDARRSTIAKAIKARGLPFLEKCATIKSLRAMLKRGELEYLPVHRRVEPLLRRSKK